MPKIEIISPGLLTTIQDSGRDNLAYYAVPKGGVADLFSARVAWSLLRQDECHPIIECTAIAPKIKFHDSVEIAISGADFGWKLNDSIISLNQVIKVNAGDVLHGKQAHKGLRGYIAINAEWQLQPIYGSFSISPNAQIGNILKKGDVIEFEVKAIEPNIILLCKGPEFDYLTIDAKQRFTTSSYTIRTDSNRMGIRLQGEPLQTNPQKLIYSVPVLPGFVQVPPSGQPIILMQDGQTTGGYPRVAYLHESEISKLAQITLGGEVRFRFV